MNRLVLESLILILVALNGERTPEMADQMDEQIGRLRAALATWYAPDDAGPGQ